MQTTTHQTYSTEMRQKLQASLRKCSEAELDLYHDFFSKRKESCPEPYELVTAEMAARKEMKL